jgi:peptidyl-prolyl cis-trans isomerase C
MVFFLMLGMMWVGQAQAKEMVRVNGVVITDQQLELATPGYNRAQKESFLNIAPLQERVLNHLIHEELLVEKAKKEGWDQKPAFEQAVESFRRKYLSQMVLDEAIASRLSTNAIRKYYDKHQEDFTSDMIHVQHILVKTEAEASDMVEQLKKPGADFKVLAEKFSQDAFSKTNGGDLGMLPRSFLDREFAKVAFRSSVGKIVGPVQTPLGFHVLKVLEKKPGKLLPFEDAQASARELLRQELLFHYLKELRKKATIEYPKEAK